MNWVHGFVFAFICVGLGVAIWGTLYVFAVAMTSYPKITLTTVGIILFILLVLLGSTR